MAAGLGFKTFNTGEVLTSADVNGYLMQGVLVFASEAARNAAITSPQEGQFAYTKDNNSLWYYTGSAWAASGATGDIEGVTAGTGISGGGTSGTVTITNSMATAIDAKGDLIVGTGADTFSRLAVGTNGQVLTADSGEATGLKFATPTGLGKVLQVVSATTSTLTSTTSTSFGDTTLTATITPTLATSKVLIFLTHNGVQKSAGNSANAVRLKLLRSATDILLISDIIGHTGTTLEGFSYSVSANYLDSPATTSATTYKTQFASNVSGQTVIVQNHYTAAGNTNSTITLMEIGV